MSDLLINSRLLGVTMSRSLSENKGRVQRLAFASHEWNRLVIDFHHFILAKKRQHLIPGPARGQFCDFFFRMKQPLDEQDLQQVVVCDKLPTQRVNPGFVGHTRKQARSHSSRRLLLGDLITLLDSCIWHFKFNAHKRHKPKMKAPDHWPLNSDYIKAQVPSKLLTRSLRRLRTG